jgi:hypothetical protein
VNEHTHIPPKIILSRKYENYFTLIKRKLRMHQIQGIKGEAVVVYCEPLITQEMGCPRLSRRVNKMGSCFIMNISHI